jgi:hypothetical protein
MDWLPPSEPVAAKATAAVTAVNVPATAIPAISRRLPFSGRACALDMFEPSRLGGLAAVPAQLDTDSDHEGFKHL